MMKRVAFVASCAALLSVGVLPSHAANNQASDALAAFAASPNMQVADIKALAHEVLKMTEEGKLASVAQQFAATTGAKSEDMRAAIEMLSEMLGNPETKKLLHQLEANPERAIGSMMGAAAGSGSPVQALLMYFLSLKNVLNGNPHLRKQIGSLIEAQTSSLVASKTSVDKILNSITQSPVFHDLTEEIEEEIASKTGSLGNTMQPISDDVGDMGR